MTVFLIILIFIFVLLTWILLVPIRLTIDSDRKMAMIRVVSVGSARILIEDNDLILRLQGFFLSKNIHFSEMGRKKKTKEKGKKEKQKGKRKRTGTSRNKRRWLIRLVKIPTSFRLSRININIDSGDYIINAYMYPLFTQLNGYRPGWRWQVNYFGRNQIYLILQTSLIRMIYVYLK